MSKNGSRGSHHSGGNTHNRSDSGDHHSRDRGSNRGSDDGGDGPLSKIGDIKDAVDGVGDIVDDVKSILEGDPMGVVGLVSDGAQLAQSLMPAAYATPIIEGGLIGLNVISKTLGFGNPNSGEDFNEGATGLESTGRGLEQAYPSSWEGSSSSAYSSQNSKQIDRTSTLIKADNQVISILKAEAEQVANTRDNMDNIATCLGAAIAPAMALMAIPIGGEPASLAFQAIAVGVATGAASMTMNEMVSNAMSNSSQLQQAIAQYQQVSSEAKLGGGSMSGAPSMPGTGNPNTSGNGDTPTGSSPGGSEPTGGTPAGGGGTSGGGTSGSGGGGTSGAGGGASSGGGGTPSSSGAGATPSTSASSPSGAAGGASGSGAGGGAGMLGSLGSLVGQVVQAATQAAGQAQQAATQAAQQAASQAQQAAGQGQEGDPNADGEKIQTVGREEPSAEQEGAAGAGSEAPGERAPIHIAVDFDAERRVEMDVHPDQVNGPIHVSLDPANPTAPPRITREV